MLIFVLLFVVSLSTVILFESKKRLGRPSWGWALFFGFVLMAVFGQINRELYAAGASGPAGLGYVFGGLTATWVGLFMFYKARTRKKSSGLRQ
jgi:hypothetical protein